MMISAMVSSKLWVAAGFFCSVCLVLAQNKWANVCDFHLLLGTT
jgi:hypothetical protein